MSTETTQGSASAVISGRQPGVPWVTPYLMVQDVLAALDFYEAAFGFQRREVHTGPDGVISHGSAVWQDGLVMMGLEGAYGGTTMAPRTTGHPSPVSIYVYCNDVDTFANHARSAGAEVKFGPMDAFYGDRICGIVDLDGYNWCFATHKGGMSRPESH